MTARRRRVDYADGTSAVFAAPEGAVYRSAVEASGLPRYLRVGGVWHDYTTGERITSTARVRELDGVPLAMPDPVTARGPARFVVDASTWCAWPADVRLALRVAGGFAKGPGVMAAEVDGRSAEHVRDLCARFGLRGVEEVV